MAREALMAVLGAAATATALRKAGATSRWIPLLVGTCRVGDQPGVEGRAGCAQEPVRLPGIPTFARAVEVPHEVCNESQHDAAGPVASGTGTWVSSPGTVSLVSRRGR